MQQQQHSIHINSAAVGIEPGGPIGRGSAHVTRPLIKIGFFIAGESLSLPLSSQSLKYQSANSITMTSDDQFFFDYVS